MMLKICIIVPVYNVENYIRRCVDSILSQSFGNFELILVDDGSPDKCGVICDEYACMDNRVHVIHQENGGLSAARNSGIDWAVEHSDSQWITFIDSDDWVHKEYLKALSHGMRENDSQISVCGFLPVAAPVEDEPLADGTVHCKEPRCAYTEHYDLCMTACCKLVPKTFFSDIRFPEGKLHEDVFVTHQLLFRAESIRIVPQKLYYYFDNPESITRTAWTERRLDGVKAHEQRLTFFREFDDESCYNRELEKTVEFVTDNLRILMDLYHKNNDYRNHFDSLRKILRPYYHEAMQRRILPANRETVWTAMFAAKTDLLWKLAVRLRTLHSKIK